MMTTTAATSGLWGLLGLFGLGGLAGLKRRDRPTAVSGYGSTGYPTGETGAIATLIFGLVPWGGFNTSPFVGKGEAVGAPGSYTTPGGRRRRTLGRKAVRT